ncbi:MAG: hypothetical protein A3F09_06180 [Chlamydiae bacterium RIFCSPHIGHO2_12_FULL_49_11]|nr:MAG: hypothetical protein A3F09_06180 [Chlamydiae bacterium RIFCSPHIGHO2_12_FULL_49_11]
MNRIVNAGQVLLRFATSAEDVDESALLQIKEALQTIAHVARGAGNLARTLTGRIGFQQNREEIQSIVHKTLHLWNDPAIEQFLELDKWQSAGNVDLAKQKIISCFKNHDTSLYFSGLKLTSLPHKALRILNVTLLNCNGCAIDKIHLSDLPQLQTLDCSDNPLQELTLERLDKLADVDCHSCALTSLYLSDLPQLKILYCSYNPLHELMLERLDTLMKVYCSRCALTRLHLSDLPQLQILFSSNNYSLQELTLERLNELAKVYCDGCALTRFRLSDLPQLQTLFFSGNHLLRELTLERLNKLAEVDCHDCALTGLHLSDLPQLQRLYCSHNPLQRLPNGIFQLPRDSNVTLSHCAISTEDRCRYYTLSRQREYEGPRIEFGESHSLLLRSNEAASSSDDTTNNISSKKRKR